MRNFLSPWKWHGTKTRFENDRQKIGAEFAEGGSKRVGQLGTWYSRYFRAGDYAYCSRLITEDCFLQKTRRGEATPAVPNYSTPLDLQREA